MPNGKTHTTMTLIAAPIVAGGAYLLGMSSAAAFLGCASGVFLSPDLDLDNGYIGLHYIRKFSPLLSLAWRAVWYPYAVIMGHRSNFSHLPIIGTVGRILYIYLWILAFCILVQFVPPIPSPWFWDYFSGLCFADFIHAVADVIHSKLVRKRA